MAGFQNASSITLHSPALLSLVHLFVVAELKAAPLTSSTTSLHSASKQRFVMPT
jgi:hypothetical protein